MKRGWMRFWVSVSALAVFFGTLAGRAKQDTQSEVASKHRQNELTLAGLRPGRDLVARALRRYPLKRPDGSEKMLSWHDDCQDYDLFVDSDRRDKVQSVRIGDANTGNFAQCELSPKFKPWWVTGKHLALDDPVSRVVDIYGQPDSRSPSTRDGKQLELLYYTFDWAGPDVPQVMEVLCTAEKDGKPGRVVEITLAGPSL